MQHDASPPRSIYRPRRGFLAGFGIVGLLLALLTSIFWIWMLIDALTNSALSGGEKVVWALVIFFLHVLGAIIYFFVGRAGKRVV